MLLRRGAADALQNLRHDAVTTAAAILTIAVSLSLFGGALLVRSEIDLMRQYFYTHVEVSVFLSDDVTISQRNSLGADLRAMPEVKYVLYESKAEAARRFRLMYRDSPELIRNVPTEALPESYRVSLHDPRRYETVAAAVRGRAGVEDVIDQKALLDQVFRVLDGLRNAALVLSALVLGAAMLLISNVVRVSAHNRRRETNLMRLVGASRARIQLPFVLEGLAAGVVGAVLATATLSGMKVLLLDRTLQPLFASGVLPPVSWSRLLGLVPALVLVSLLITTTASYLSTRRHVRA